MMKRLIVLVTTVFLMCSVAVAKDASEVKLPDSIKAGKSDLLLNGTGIRVKKIAFVPLELYVAGLYVAKKNSNPDAIMNADEEMVIKLQITSKLINSDNMSEAVNEGFEKSTGGNTAPLRTDIDDMIKVFSSEIKVDDVYDFVYVPGEGTQIIKNGTISKTIKGLEFKKALFGIWIGNEPCQDDLKKSLIGA